MRLTRYLLILAAVLAAAPAAAQQTFVPLNKGVIYVNSAPSGACVSGQAPAQWNIVTGIGYSCLSNVWTAIPAQPATTAAALAANGANCAAGTFPLGVDASGAAEGCTSSLSGNASTASALAANGANCPAGQSPLGVSASGAAESCFAPMLPADYDPGVDGAVDIAEFSTVAGTAGALSADGGNCSAGSFPLGVDASGAVQSCTALSSSAAGTAAALAADPANCSAGSAAGGVTAAGTAEACVDPIVNLGTDPVGTTPIANGGTNATSFVANGILYHKSGVVQSTLNWTFDDSAGLMTAKSPSDARCRVIIGPGTLTLGDDADCPNFFDLIASAKSIIIGTSGPGMLITTTTPGAQMSFSNSEGTGLTIENGAANMTGMVAPDATIDGGLVQPDELIPPHGASLPAASGCPIANHFILTSAASGEQDYYCEDTDADGTGDSYVHPPGGGAPVGPDDSFQRNASGSAGSSDCGSPGGVGITCAGTGEFGTSAADGTWGRITRENTTDLAAPAADGAVNRVAFYYKSNHQPYIRHTGGAVEQVCTSANETGDIALAISGNNIDYQLGANSVGAAEITDNTVGTAEIDETAAFTWTGTDAGNQTVSGNKTFSGTNTFSGQNTVSGGINGTRLFICGGRATATTSDTYLAVGGNMSSTMGMRMMRAGSITGISVQLDATAQTTPGTIDFNIQKAASVVLATTVTTSGVAAYGNSATQARNTDTFAANDLIQFHLDLNTFVGTVTGVIACMEFIYD